MAELGRRADLKHRVICGFDSHLAHHLSQAATGHALRAVLDTSPLQGLWRAGALGKLPLLFESVCISLAVADETRRSLDIVGSKRVPNLREHPWIQTEPVAREVLLAAMIPLFQAHGQRVGGAKASTRQPEIGIVRGKVIAWTTTKTSTNSSQLGFDVPDLESVLLAQKKGAIAILDDRKALRAALDLGVRTATTREVLRAMMRRRIIADDASAIARMREADYHATVRVAHAWDGTD